MSEDAVRPGWIASRLRGKLRDVKRPACFSVADRRVSKLRPWLRVSHAAGMRNRSERKTCLPTGRRTPTSLLGKKHRESSVPRCPADGAINPRSPDRCPAGEGPTSNFTRWTWTEDEGPMSNSVDSARAGCEGPTSNSAVASIPSWATLRSTRATGITHPGFYGRKPWRKPNSAFIITAPATRCEGLSSVAAQIVRFRSCLGHV